MPLISERVGYGPLSTPAGEPQYAVLSFGTRSAAVRYCLQVSAALADEGERTSLDGDARATVWLAATDSGGAFHVFACNRALAAARAARLEAIVVGRIRGDQLPTARCLVVGDPGRLAAY